MQLSSCLLTLSVGLHLVVDIWTTWIYDTGGCVWI